MTVVTTIIAVALSAAPESIDIVLTFDGGIAEGITPIAGTVSAGADTLCRFNLGLRTVDQGRVSIPIDDSCRSAITRHVGQLGEKQSRRGIVNLELGSTQVGVDVSLIDYVPGLVALSNELDRGRTAAVRLAKVELDLQTAVSNLADAQARALAVEKELAAARVELAKSIRQVKTLKDAVEDFNRKLLLEKEKQAKPCRMIPMPDLENIPSVP